MTSYTISLTGAVAALMIVTGCGVSRPAVMPSVKPVPDSFMHHADSGSIANISWRTFFTDPHLLALIDTTLKNNPDLQIALQHIDIAKAQLSMRRAALFPAVDGVISASGDKYGDYTMTGVGNFDTNLSPNIDKDQRVNRDITPDFFVGFRSTWEIDLWGKLKNQKKAVIAQFLASEKGRHFAITNIVAEVATLYYDLLALDNEMKIVHKNIQLQQEALEVVKIQKEGGRATELAVKQFSAQLLNTRAIEFSLRQRMTETENQLNMLAGRYTGYIPRDTSIMQQQTPQIVHTGIPSELLARRPDIRQAELELEAAKANVAAARAAFYPSLNLSPAIGFNAFKAGLLFNGGSLAYGAASSLTAPVFNRKQVRAGYAIANAETKQAIHHYQKTLLNSFMEVNNQLQYIDNNTRSFELKSEEVSELTNAVSAARDLYLAGYANYLEVITAQKGVLEAEIQLIENKQNLLQGVVQLYRALGGGWE